MQNGKNGSEAGFLIISRNNESLQIKVHKRELKEVDNFQFLGSVVTRDGYCTREINMRIVLPKKHLTEKCHSWQAN